MSRPRLAAAALAALVVLPLAACGAQSGDSDPGVSLLVTRDHGAKVLSDVGPAPVSGTPTLIAYLKANVDAATFAEIQRGPAQVFVNGVGGESPVTTEVHPGDRVWWDQSTGARSRAVVGSYPEPFEDGLDGKRWPTRVECVPDADKTPCDAIADKLGKAGIVAAQALVGTEGGDVNVRVLVGPWADVRGDRATRLLEQGPRASGVFARFTPDGRQLQLLGPDGTVASTAGAGAGLIAAIRFEDQPPTWIVTGTDAAGVAAAVQAFDEGTLGNRFALAVVDDQGKPLPVTPLG
jgi:hypothetical protein